MKDFNVLDDLARRTQVNPKTERITMTEVEKQIFSSEVGELIQVLLRQVGPLSIPEAAPIKNALKSALEERLKELQAR